MSAVRAYRAVYNRRVVELLGGWVSELEPIIFTAIDVSPQVLAIVGIGIEGDAAPRISTKVTVADVITAGGLA